jgi:hypothetical protein
MKILKCKIALAFGLLVNFQALANQGLFSGSVYRDDSGGSYTLTEVEECRDLLISFREDTEAMSCRSQRAIRSGLQATGITLSMCTMTGSIPMNAKVSFAIASAALQLASFVVDHVPCDDAENDQKAVTRICSMLEKQGIKCDAQNVNFKREVSR